MSAGGARASRDERERQRLLQERMAQAHSCEEIATLVGWAADEAHLDEARKITHDGLIDGLGTRRRTGIWWTQHTGTEALTVLNLMRSDESPTSVGRDVAHATYDATERLLKLMGGWLVIAFAGADLARTA